MWGREGPQVLCRMCSYFLRSFSQKQHWGRGGMQIPLKEGCPVLATSQQVLLFNHRSSHLAQASGLGQGTLLPVP